MSTSSPLFQFLHDQAGALGGVGPEEEVKMVRHQNPADQSKAHLAPKVAEDLDKVMAETLAVKEPGAAIGAAGEKLRFARGIMAFEGGHEQP